MISYGQGFSDWIPKDDGKSLDLPFAIVAHQWTVPIAFVEGAPVMSEPSSKLLRSVTSACAPTRQKLAIAAWFSTVALMPTSEVSAMVQPCSMT